MAEVQVFLRKRYQCTTCQRSYAHRATAAKHAAECIKDPATRACATCEHDDRGENPSYDDPGSQAACEIGARPETVQCVRHCEQWEPNRYIARAQAGRTE